MSTLKDYSWIVNRFKEFEEQIISLYDGEHIPELEEFNFKIDSSNWEIKIVDWLQIKVNPEWDIFEYVNCINRNTIWEQLFTWDAAMRETKKVNKKMPTDREFCFNLSKNNDITNMIYPWLLDDSWLCVDDSKLYGRKAFRNRYSLVSYWTTTEMIWWNKDYYYCRSLASDYNWFIFFYLPKDICCSVRCIKNIIIMTKDEEKQKFLFIR